jgi:two-component system OmpR family sensor kinase
MGSIVDDLLLLSKLDRGRELNDDEVDLTGLLEDSARDARAVQPDRMITVSAPATLGVIGDSFRLQQVLAALVYNALVHTPLDTPIELSGQMADEFVMVEVRDHGPGMDAESESHAFERFYRGDPSRSRHTGGSGLGLAIAKSIVEAHGGRITLQTEPGHGCRFVITLPMRSSRPLS